MAKDVADILELGPAWNAARILAADEKGTHIVSTPGGPQKTLTISESGLYALIFKSRKPQAQAFRKWVTSEVLPSIRKHGGYLTPQAQEHQSPRLERPIPQTRKNPTKETAD